MRKRVLTPILLGLAVLASSLGLSAATHNHLAGQTSVYLSRAAQQPVDWYPWSAEAFQRAKELNRPILLDVGAVWCPWCSLMDRDTYTNPQAADYINEHFVAVKVDFDASPKLVAQLQRAQAVLNLSAGLPLTSFITPDGKLYSGAGYLPAQSKGDKHSFRSVAEEAVQDYTNKQKLDNESFQLEIAK
ncbi:MAG TPA: DUF255 domain-containing protein [Candidatus Sulfotelmatobacter sp.]|nr:DUF255 domain-containing protein [Candidatus Sulfotelmatobacter sp.]